MTDKKKIIIGSRGSKLSLAYSSHVKDLLIKSDPQLGNNSIEIKIIKTSGDIFQNKKISDIGGKGVFCKQIEDELLNSKIDLAVHSLKDIPTIIVVGRYDVICPPIISYEFNKKLNNSELIIVDKAGHTMHERNIQKELVDASNRIYKKLK